MLVESLMTREPEVCRPESSLAEAAAIMWRRDCGVVPVTDGDDRLVGVITDRDICMALTLSGRRASEARVGEVMARDVQTCTPVDDVREALEAMRKRQVRRLPVVNSLGMLVGLLSINDIILHTSKGKKHVSRRGTLKALRAICRPHGSDASDEGDKAVAEADKGGEDNVSLVSVEFFENIIMPEVEKARTLMSGIKKARAQVEASETGGKRKRARKSKRKSAGEAANANEGEGESAVADKSESVVEGEGGVAE